MYNFITTLIEKDLNVIKIYTLCSVSPFSRSLGGEVSYRWFNMDTNSFSIPQSISLKVEFSNISSYNGRWERVILNRDIF